jgi:hypothetical protein
MTILVSPCELEMKSVVYCSFLIEYLGLRRCRRKQKRYLAKVSGRS